MTKYWKGILALALPSIASFATATVSGTINLVLIGKLGAIAIAVVGVSNIIMYNAWALFSGVGNTVNYLVAQCYGAGEIKRAVERTYVALYICVIAAVLIFLTGAFFSSDVLKLMGGSGDLVTHGEGYIKLRFYAMIFSIFAFVFQGFLRGIGDTKTPMVISIIGSLCMVLFTYTLTYGKWGMPEMGLTGAGIAFLIGEAVTMLICAYIFFVKLHPRFHTRKAGVRLAGSESRLILSESTKLGVQEFALSMSMFIFTMFVTRLGTHALAANEVSLSVMSFGFMPAFAFGSTATILVGQEVGKGNPKLAKRLGTDTAVLGSIFLLILGIIEFVYAEPIARIYTSDPQVYKLSAYLISISAFLQLFDGFINFYAGGLRGIGDTSFLLKASMILGWLLFIPLAWLLTIYMHFGSVGAWISLYTFLMVFGISTMIRFYRTNWSEVKIKTADQPAAEKIIS